MWLSGLGAPAAGATGSRVEGEPRVGFGEVMPSGSIPTGDIAREAGSVQVADGLGA